MKRISWLLISLLLLAFTLAIAAQQTQQTRRPAQTPRPAQPLPPLPPGTAGIRGVVLDQTGGLIPGATVAILSLEVSKDMNANDFGEYSFRGIPPGSYNVTAFAKGFANIQISSVELTAGQDKQLDLTLLVASTKEVVKVEESNLSQLNVDASSNVGAIVIKGRDRKSVV